MAKKLDYTDARVGKRIEIGAHYDLWMQGARYGVIAAVALGASKDGKDILHVRMDHPQVKKLARILDEDAKYL